MDEGVERRGQLGRMGLFVWGLEGRAESMPDGGFPPPMQKRLPLSRSTARHSSPHLAPHLFTPQELRDSEVIIRVTRDGLRPTFPPGCPPGFKKLAEQVG